MRTTAARRGRFQRRGATFAEVLVVLVLATFAVLTLLVVMPRQRENARSAGCQKSLMQIGIALSLYDRSEGSLPAVRFGGDGPAGPLRQILESLVLPDLNGLQPGETPKPQPGSVPGERVVPGFVCASDPNALSGRWPAPISFRATAGDRPDGANGGFAPGRPMTLRAIDGADGKSFTAAFSERLVGDGVSGPGATRYMEVDGPVGDEGCAPSVAAPVKADAGNSWYRADWVSTLYNHVLPPNGGPSCVARDGNTASMGASSGHPGGVHVLTFDGGVRTVTPTVAPPIWRALATVESPRRPEPTPPLPVDPDEGATPPAAR